MLAVSLRRLVLSVVTVAVLSIATGAHAQTITLPAVLSRRDAIRPTGQQPHWINRADCLDQDIISFPLTLTAYAGLTLQVWAANQSVDCSPPAERQPGGQAECWLVYSAPAVQQMLTVNIPAINIVGRVLPSDATGTTADNVPTPMFPDVCTSVNAPTGQQLSLYFYFISSGTTIVGPTTTVWKDIGYDISPPSAPTNIAAGPGETRIHLDWTDSPEQDVRAYQFYCDPPRGAVLPDGGIVKTQGPPIGTLSLALLDAGLGAGGFFTGLGTGGIGTGGFFTGLGTGGFGTGGFGTGGTGGISSSGGAGGAGGAGGTAGTNGTGVVSESGGAGGSTSQVSCSSSSALQPNIDPLTLDSSYKCGQVAGTLVTSGTVSNLVNNTPYVVGIAAVDAVGNVGALSQNVCSTPVEVTDFFELYRSAGGKAGGGICSLNRGKNPAAPGLLFVAGMLVAAGAARRSRRRRS